MPEPDGPHHGRRLGRRDVDRHPAEGVDGRVSFSVSARHVACSDDRAVGAHIHPTRLLPLRCERETIRHPPPAPCAVREVHHSATVETRNEIRRALERGRTATEGLLAPVSDDDLVAQVSPARPAARLELRACRPLRGALDPPHARGRAPHPGRPRPRLRRVPPRTLERSQAPDAEPHGRARLRRGRAGAVVRRARARRSRGPGRPRHGTASSSASSSRTSCSRRSRCSRRCSAGRAPSTATSRRQRPTAHRAGRTRSRCRAARSPSAPCTSRGRTTTSSSRTRRSCRRFASTGPR